MSLQELCKAMFRVHGWQPLIEIWVDEYGFQRIAMKYSLPDDEEDGDLRIFHEINNIKPFPSYEAMVEQFCKECSEGLGV